MSENNQPIDLCGKICPFPVVDVIREIDKMQKGQVITFLVDDPLAIKSIPEELREYPDMTLEISEKDKKWKIVISRQG